MYSSVVTRWTLTSAVGLLLSASAGVGAQPVQPQAPGPSRGDRLAPLPLTQLDDRAMATELDSRTFTLTFSQPLAVRDLLLLLVRGTSLSVVPYPAVSGSFIGELKNVTVRQALSLILQPLGLDYAVDGSFIRVFKRQPETRIYEINYLAVSRAGASAVGRRQDAGSFARVATTAESSVFDDVARSVQGLLTPGAAFSIDRKAGLLQATDFPERLERVATYLDAVHDRVHRQVQVEARVVEIELTDPSADALDWDALARAVGDARPGRSLLNGLRVRDVASFLTALRLQGTVSVLATPRVLVLNNELAVLRTAIDPAALPAARSTGAAEFSLGVTPRIESDGAIMLSVTPIVERTKKAEGRGDAPNPAVQEVDTLARIGDGETVVLGALTGAGREPEEQPVVGRLLRRRPPAGRGTRTEVLFLLTARVMAAVGTR